MKTNPKNQFVIPSHWKLQDNPDQEQQEGPPAGKASFLGEAEKELGIIKEEPKKEEEKQEEKEEKQEEKEENKEEKPKNEEPLFRREKKEEKKEEKQEKPDKEKSIEIVRSQRDEYKGKYETLQAQVSKLGDGVELTVISPLLDYIKESAGDDILTPEKVSALVEAIKTKDQRLEQISKEANETKGKLREINIDFDEDFQRDYVIPFKTNEESLLLEYAQVDANGEVLGKESVRKVVQGLFGTREKPVETEKLTATQVSGLLSQYAKDYKAETGEDLPALSVSNVMGSLRNFIKSRDALRNARSDWENTKKEAQTRAQAKAQQEQELAGRKMKDTRKNFFQKAFNELDESKYDGIFSSEEIGDYFTSEYKFSEKMFEDKPPGWDELALRGFKAATHDALIEKIKEKDAEIETLRKQVGGELRGAGGEKRKITTGEKVSFLGEADKFLHQ